MTFQIFNHRTLIANQPDPNPLNGFIVFNTDDQELIADLLNIEQQNSIGLRIYNTDTQYATLVVENPDIMWEQLGSPITGGNEYFGEYVSMSSDGTRVVIGSNGSTSTAPYARIYEYTASPPGWNQLGGDISEGLASDNSSARVSISADGTRVAIGFIRSAATAGTTKVYEYSGSNWTQVGVNINGEAAGDQSGWSVSLNIDGTILAIGSNQSTVGSLSYTKIYQYSNPNWTQLGQNIDGEITGDGSGRSVSLSSDGSRVAIGAPYFGSTALGYVRVYEYSSTPSPLWSKVGNNIVGDNNDDDFGHSVSLDSSGTRVAIGAPGSAYTRIYEYTTSWTQLGEDITNTLPHSQSGYSVSLNDDGTRVVIGDPSDVEGAIPLGGSVKVYDYTAEWSQAGQSILGQNPLTRLGSGVSLNGNGDKMIVGVNSITPISSSVNIYESVIV